MLNRKRKKLRFFLRKIGIFLPLIFGRQKKSIKKASFYGGFSFFSSAAAKVSSRKNITKIIILRLSKTIRVVVIEIVALVKFPIGLSDGVF
jgi:hypothetical protein